MDKEKLRELLKERRHINNSANYWRYAIHHWTEEREKWKDNENHRQSAIQQIAFCEKKLAALLPELEKLTQQITEIDPKGSILRQKNSLRSNISHAKLEIKSLETRVQEAPEKAQSYWLTKIEAKKCKLIELDKKLQEIDSSATRAANKEECLEAHAHAYGWWAEETAKAEESAHNAPEPPTQGGSRAKP